MKRKTTCILLIMALMLSNVQASPVMASEEYTSDVVSDEDEISVLSDDLSDEQEVTVEEQQDISGVSDGEDLFQDSETDFEEDDKTDEGFSYEIRNDEVTITGYNGDAQNGLNIPEMMEGYPVTSIKSRAFAKVDNFSGTLVIPSTVTYIGKNIFVKREYSDDEYKNDLVYCRVCEHTACFEVKHIVCNENKNPSLRCMYTVRVMLVYNYFSSAFFFFGAILWPE